MYRTFLPQPWGGPPWPPTVAASQPCYAYIRRRGTNPEDPQDLMQDSLVKLLWKNYPARADRAKGRFRNFLLHALDQFLAD